EAVAYGVGRARTGLLASSPVGARADEGSARPALVARVARPSLHRALQGENSYKSVQRFLVSLISFFPSCTGQLHKPGRGILVMRSRAVVVVTSGVVLGLAMLAAGGEASAATVICQKKSGA